MDFGNNSLGVHHVMTDFRDDGVSVRDVMANIGDNQIRVDRKVGLQVEG